MIRISYAVWYLQRFNIDYWFCYVEEGWAVYHNLSSSSFPPKNVLRFCFIWFHIRNTYCSPSMIIHLSHILSLSFCLSHSLFPSLSLYLSLSLSFSLGLPTTMTDVMGLPATAGLPKNLSELSVFNGMPVEHANRIVSTQSVILPRSNSSSGSTTISTLFISLCLYFCLSVHLHLYFCLSVP